MEVQSLQVNRNASAQTAVVGTDQQGKSIKEEARRRKQAEESKKKKARRKQARES
jgi:malonyl CoA-acyl carrier protein transacylase